MRRVVRYEHGRAVWSDNGPARARPTGYGGAALGSFIAPTLVAPKPRVRLPRQPLNRKKP